MNKLRGHRASGWRGTFVLLRDRLELARSCGLRLHSVSVVMTACATTDTS